MMALSGGWLYSRNVAKYLAWARCLATFFISLKIFKEIFLIPIPCLICYHILKVDIQIAEKLFFRGKKSFDKIEKIEYSIHRELATECVSMGVDAEKRVRKRDSA